MIIEETGRLDHNEQVSIDHLWKRCHSAILKASTGSPIADRYAGLVEVRGLIGTALDQLRKAILEKHRDNVLEHHAQAEPGSEIEFRFKGRDYVVDLDVYVPNRINWKAVAQHYAEQPNFQVVVGRCTDANPAVRINTGEIVR